MSPIIWDILYDSYCLNLLIGFSACNRIALWCSLFDVDHAGFIYDQNIRPFYILKHISMSHSTQTFNAAQNIPCFRIRRSQTYPESTFDDAKYYFRLNIHLFLDILTGSALSAFGSISLDCSFDQSGDFMSPPIEETNQIKSPVQQPAAQPKAWATVARK